MIQINLIPDVKQELIRAQQVRSTVITIAIITGMAAVAIVVLLLLWIFVVQLGRGLLVDNTIKDESTKFSQVADISDTLTIQNQLAVLPNLTESRHIDSRLFDVLTTINPPAPNTITISKFDVDTATNTVTLDAQAAAGYPALETFKKTIIGTSFEYTKDGETESIPLSNNVIDSERSYGEDITGAKVLRFSLTFTYTDELLAVDSSNARIIAPNRTNVTDSYLGVPTELFNVKATDIAPGAGN